jgi:transcriptional regulator with XRE-family HTH domain
MSMTAKKIWKSFQKNKNYRHSYVAAHIADTIAAQIFSLRERKKWSQQELAAETGMKLSRISALENSVYENVTIGTLKRLSEAFDVALTVRFTPFAELANWVSSLSIEKISIPSYSEEVIYEKNNQKIIVTSVAYSSQEKQSDPIIPRLTSTAAGPHIYLASSLKGCLPCY